MKLNITAGTNEITSMVAYSLARTNLLAIALFQRVISRRCAIPLIRP